MTEDAGLSRSPVSKHHYNPLSSPKLLQPVAVQGTRTRSMIMDLFRVPTSPLGRNIDVPTSPGNMAGLPGAPPPTSPTTISLVSYVNGGNQRSMSWWFAIVLLISGASIGSVYIYIRRSHEAFSTKEGYSNWWYPVTSCTTASLIFAIHVIFAWQLCRVLSRMKATLLWFVCITFHATGVIMWRCMLETAHEESIETGEKVKADYRFVQLWGLINDINAFVVVPACGGLFANGFTESPLSVFAVLLGGLLAIVNVCLAQQKHDIPEVMMAVLPVSRFGGFIVAWIIMCIYRRYKQRHNPGVPIVSTLAGALACYGVASQMFWDAMVFTIHVQHEVHVINWIGFLPPWFWVGVVSILVFKIVRRFITKEVLPVVSEEYHKLLMLPFDCFPGLFLTFLLATSQSWHDPRFWILLVVKFSLRWKDFHFGCRRFHHAKPAQQLRYSNHMPS
jgi:hypothetical protein